MSMTMLSRPAVVAWRNRLRRNAVARWLYRRWMAGRDYEDRFGRSLLAAVGEGSVVWDVGANVGLYSARFLARGARAVVCFEPAPAAARALEAKFGRDPRVRLFALALADSSGTAPFRADGAAPTNRLGSPAGSAPAHAIVQVPLRRGADVLAEHGLDAPNVVKIDVEGYEWEVLKGLGRLLDRAEVRAVFVEVHFSILHERGLDQAPGEIVALLERAGYAVRWLDLSHVAAVRSASGGS